MTLSLGGDFVPMLGFEGASVTWVGFEVLLQLGLVAEELVATATLDMEPKRFEGTRVGRNFDVFFYHVWEIPIIC